MLDTVSLQLHYLVIIDNHVRHIVFTATLSGIWSSQTILLDIVFLTYLHLPVITDNLIRQGVFTSTLTDHQRHLLDTVSSQPHYLVITDNPVRHGVFQVLDSILTGHHR